ncbi:MAG: hypothetical protein JSS02_17555 [Planctomycetes bacterium]|nr:hypothetical protein [Planctomycetota bacterium]
MRESDGKGDSTSFADGTSLKSSFFEQLVEHVFIAEVLQEAWYHFHEVVEVLRSEVDAFGYDLVLECNGVTRHAQLKTSKAEAKAARQNVNQALAANPNICVVWIFRDENPETFRMQPQYLFFGGNAKKPLPRLDKFKLAKHTKGDARGIKHERREIRVVPKSKFKSVGSTRELVEILFGLRPPTDADAQQG